MGGYVDYTAVNSQEFQKILVFVKAKHPELNNLSPNLV